MAFIKHGSLILLGNLIPLAGYLLLSWDTQHVLLFYIAELVIVELTNAAKIGILTYSREIKITTKAASLFGAVLIVLFHLAVFLLSLLFLLAIAFLAGGYGAGRYEVGNPLAPVIAFLTSNWPVLALLAVDRSRDFVSNFYRNRQYRRIDLSRFLRSSLLRQSATVLAALLFAVLFRRGVGHPAAFVVLVVILKSGAEMLMDRGLQGDGS